MHEEEGSKEGKKRGQVKEEVGKDASSSTFTLDKLSPLFSFLSGKFVLRFRRKVKEKTGEMGFASLDKTLSNFHLLFNV